VFACGEYSGITDPNPTSANGDEAGGASYLTVPAFVPIRNRFIFPNVPELPYRKMADFLAFLPFWPGTTLVC
jgi:hypothetical protein